MVPAVTLTVTLPLRTVTHKKVVDGIKKPDYSDRAMKTIYGERITRIIEQWDNIATCVIDGQVQLIHITKIIKP